MFFLFLGGLRGPVAPVAGARGLLILVAALLAPFAFWQKDQAVSALLKAEKARAAEAMQRDRADASAAIAEHERVQAEHDRDVATKLQRDAETQQARTEGAERNAARALVLAETQDALARKSARDALDSAALARVAEKRATDEANVAREAQEAEAKARKQVEAQSAVLKAQAAALEKIQADQQFRIVTSEPIPRKVDQAQVALYKLIEATEEYAKKWNQLPDGAEHALATLVPATLLVAGDVSSSEPVILAMPDPDRPGQVYAFRQATARKPVTLSASATDRPPWMEPVKRQAWAVQQLAVSEPDYIALGGVGGFVAAGQTKQRPLKAKKLFPFAITGLAFSTDGKWVVSANSAGGLRVQSLKDFSSNWNLTSHLVQVASGFKLAAFLVTRTFGEYPIRECAIALKRYPGQGKTGRGDLSVVVLTESGRLLLWTHPGPIGKQISSAERLHWM